MNTLQQVYHTLKKKQTKNVQDFYVPVIHDLNRPAEIVSVNPFEYFSEKVERIIHSPARERVSGKHGEWSRKAVIYNLFVRLATAFDHDGNGKLDLPKNSAGFRETGTFLKSIALLPHLERLGVNTIHLLPITSIGSDGNKGRLGSPYAIRNAFKIDENLAEPMLGLGVEKEFKAFVEAAHHLGMRVVVEFVFRTASKDADWVKDHPEWFYWIREEIPNRKPGSDDADSYGPPIFPKDDLVKVKEKVLKEDFTGTTPPPENYRKMFREPPLPGRIKMEKGQWIGTLKDGTRVKIAGAFADWPPDDNQPPWNDVTYLRMYDHPDFNYIAYNTIRMYDTRLARAEHANLPLWKTVEDIVPHYQRDFGIDGVMIDMGHALPLKLLEQMVHKARQLDPDFAFWEENFNPTEESREHGYNAAIGYLWSDENDPVKMRKILQRYSTEKFPVPYFGASESHNSPRAASLNGGTLYSRFSWAVNNMLPVIPFIHNGFELGEKNPVNTGLNFTPEQIARLPSENLPLFSEGMLKWKTPDIICDWIAKVSAIRVKYLDLLSDPAPETVVPWHLGDEKTFVFERKNSSARLLVTANGDFKSAKHLEINHNELVPSLTDLFTSEPFVPISGKFKVELLPGQVRIFEIR